MNELKSNFKINIKDFDIKINIKNKFSTRYIKPAYSPEIPEKRLKYKLAQDLAKELKLHENMRYFVVVDGMFIFGDLIEAVLTENMIQVKKMTISTLSMSENNIDSLHNLIIGGFIKQLNIIISDYFFSHERNNLIQYIYEKLDIGDSFQLAVASSHMKITSFETMKGNKMVWHGSANLRSSSNLEQLMFEENKDIYDFIDKINDDILLKYATINKSVRNSTLWNSIN